LPLTPLRAVEFGYPSSLQAFIVRGGRNLRSSGRNAPENEADDDIINENDLTLSDEFLRYNAWPLYRRAPSTPT